MYPYPLFWEIDLYTIFLCVGIIGAILSFRLLADKIKIHWRVQNFVVLVAFASIIVGYFSAVLFQAFYDIESRGKFIIDTQTGATFTVVLSAEPRVFLLSILGSENLFSKRKSISNLSFLLPI